jgi:membrane-associated phospholipid phosphatase
VNSGTWTRERTAAAAAWALVLGFALALSLAAAVRDRLPGDLRVTEAVQDVPGLGRPSEAVRAVTSTEVVLVAGVAVALALWFSGYRAHAVGLAAGLIVLPLLQSGIKELVDRPRPDPALVAIRAEFSSPSFPAGHVMSGTYLYGYLLVFSVLQWGKGVAGRAAAAILAIVVLFNGMANIYEGVHWPSDVLGGYLWAGVLLIPALAGAEAWRRGRFPTIRRPG